MKFLLDGNAISVTNLDLWNVFTLVRSKLSFYFFILSCFILHTLSLKRKLHGSDAIVCDSGEIGDACTNLLGFAWLCDQRGPVERSWARENDQNFSWSISLWVMIFLSSIYNILRFYGYHLPPFTAMTQQIYG